MVEERVRLPLREQKIKFKIMGKMGRPRLGKELKKPSDYTYDYPDQRELAAGLHHGDITRLAAATGYSASMIHDMVTGRRKMPDRVKRLIEKYHDLNRQKVA
jgi:hypothetical protein